jgi:hypothetical protein
MLGLERTDGVATSVGQLCLVHVREHSLAADKQHG